MKLLKLGLAAGALALTTLGAQAQTTSNSSTGTGTGSTTSGTAGTTMSGSSDSTTGGSMAGSSMAGSSMTGSSMMGASMTPTPVSGTVTRYYVDSAGFVSAMDVQTSSGTQMVRFSPSMAQRLTSMFPAGSTISGFVTPSASGGFDLAGTGTNMPAPGAMMPSTVNDLDILRAPAYVTLGAKEQQVEGKLTGFVSDPNNGQVLAIILDKTTLVRVPQESRLDSSTMADEGVTEMFPGASVVARGVEEAPRYGTISPFSRRIVATAIDVNGRGLGAMGFGRLAMSRKARKMMMGDSMMMGYSPYMAPGDTSAAASSTPDASATTGSSATTGTGTGTTTAPAQ